MNDDLDGVIHPSLHRECGKGPLISINEVNETAMSLIKAIESSNNNGRESDQNINATNLNVGHDSASAIASAAVAAGVKRDYLDLDDHDNDNRHMNNGGGGKGTKRSKLPTNYRKFISNHNISVQSGRKKNWIYLHYELVGEKDNDSNDNEIENGNGNDDDDETSDLKDVLWICKHCGRTVGKESTRYENNSKLRKHLSTKGNHGDYYWDKKGIKQMLTSDDKKGLKAQRSRMVYYDKEPHFPVQSLSKNSTISSTPTSPPLISSSSTSNSQNLRSEKDSNDNDNKSNNNLTRDRFFARVLGFIASTNTSFKDVCNQSFIDLFKKSNQFIELRIDSSTISEYANESYLYYKNSIKSQLSLSTSCISIILEYWNDDNNNLTFVILCSWIDDSFKQNLQILDTIQIKINFIDDKNTDEIIVEKFNRFFIKTIEFYEIKNRILTINGNPTNLIKLIIKKIYNEKDDAYLFKRNQKLIKDLPLSVDFGLIEIYDKLTDLIFDSEESPYKSLLLKLKKFLLKVSNDESNWIKYIGNNHDDNYTNYSLSYSIENNNESTSSSSINNNNDNNNHNHGNNIQSLTTITNPFNEFSNVKNIKRILPQLFEIMNLSKPFIQQYLNNNNENENESLILTDDEWQSFEKIYIILRPINQSILLFSNQLSNISIIYNNFELLYNHLIEIKSRLDRRFLNNNQEDNYLIQKVELIFLKFQNYYYEINISSIFRLSSLLNPLNVKRTLPELQNDQEDFLQPIIKLLTKHLSTNSKEKNSNTNNSNEGDTTIGEFLDPVLTSESHDDNANNNGENTSNENNNDHSNNHKSENLSVMNQFTLFTTDLLTYIESSSGIQTDKNLLQWWNFEGKYWGSLNTLAKDFLSIPISSHISLHNYFINDSIYSNNYSSSSHLSLNNLNSITTNPNIGSINTFNLNQRVNLLQSQSNDNGETSSLINGGGLNNNETILTNNIGLSGLDINYKMSSDSLKALIMIKKFNGVDAACTRYLQIQGISEM